MTEYGTLEYWEKRYDPKTSSVRQGIYENKSVHFEWYFDYKSIQPIVSKYLNDVRKENYNDDNAKLKILHVGCGNSYIGEDMAKENWGTVINIDFSPTVIANMKNRNVESEELQYVEMDATNLTYDNETFDLVIEKGTIDAIVCAEDGDNLVNKTIAESLRVLKPRGFFISISFGKPERRLCFLEQPHLNWEKVAIELLPESNQLDKGPQDMDYLYIWRKK